MTGISPTPLERALLEHFYEFHALEGFPSPDAIVVVSRKNTGTGRWVLLDTPASMAKAEDTLYMDDHWCILIPSVEEYLFAMVHVREHKLSTLEIVTNGAPWGGDETGWTIESRAEPTP